MDRNEILRRFEQCLDTALAEEDPPAGIPAELLSAPEPAADGSAMDWYTMWAAVTALTQEVRLQGRAFKQMGETLAADAERRSRKEALGGLLEMRERLLRGLEAVRGREKLQPGLWDRIFQKRWRRVQHALEVVVALEEGYRLSLGYLDDLLFQFQVQPIKCEGRKFDPRRMNAVDVEETDDAEEGTVVSVYRMGYEWNGELFRPAQVRVARRPRSVASNE
ncbi:MAG: nucleotide exchange factor GrpE [Acidobacteriia bacterium]|nr:nucleotide exchange factor GrpE [Terriglobia bacterium]